MGTSFSATSLIGSSTTGFITGSGLGGSGFATGCSTAAGGGGGGGDFFMDFFDPPQAEAMNRRMMKYKILLFMIALRLVLAKVGNG